jgi:hypothetical protein
MSLTPTHQRQRAHAFLDQLPDKQLSAVCSLLDTMLSPLDRILALGPMDDEPFTPDDAAAILSGTASPGKTGGVSMEEVLADFGLTLNDFHQMAEDSPLDDAASEPARRPSRA